MSLKSINCLQKQTSIFTSSLLTTSGFVVVEPKRVNNILMHYLLLILWNSSRHGREAHPTMCINEWRIMTTQNQFRGVPWGA